MDFPSKFLAVVLVAFSLWSLPNAQAQERERRISKLGGSQVCQASDIEKDPEAVRSQDLISKEGQEIRRAALYLTVKIEKVDSSGQVASTCSAVRTSPVKIVSAGHCFLEFGQKGSPPATAGYSFRAVMTDANGKTRRVPIVAPQGQWDHDIDLAVAGLAVDVPLPPSVTFPSLSQSGCGAPMEPARESGGLTGFFRGAGRAIVRKNLSPAFLVGYGVLDNSENGSVTSSCPKIVPLNNLKQHGRAPALWVDFDRTRSVSGIAHGKGCFGDSGGPIFCRENGRLVVGGITAQVNPNRDPQYAKVLRERFEGKISSLKACQDSGNTGLWTISLNRVKNQLESLERDVNQTIYGGGGVLTGSADGTR